jgi:hypothetical protein
VMICHCATGRWQAATWSRIDAFCFKVYNYIGGSRWWPCSLTTKGSFLLREQYVLKQTMVVVNRQADRGTENDRGGRDASIVFALSTGRWN